VSARKYWFFILFVLTKLLESIDRILDFPHGIRLINSLDNTVLINFNAPNEHDRKKFVNDVRECIAEVQQMESLRIGGKGLST